MNRPIRKVCVVLGVLFLALFVNLNVVQVLQGKSYRNNPQNRRVLLHEYSSPRGQIVVAGRAVAESRRTNDELKYLRVYPQGPVYAPVTGYYSFIYGADGVELTNNTVLSGNDSRLFGSNLDDLLTGRNPRGGSVELTLSRAAQQAAYRALGNRRGAVVALNPTTGAVLAAVSRPSYDPNKLSGHNAAAIQRASEAYNKDPAQPMLNRAFGEVYPSGSVFKIIDSAAALQLMQDRKAITPGTSISAPNSYWPLQPKRTSACPTNLEAACVQNFDGETCDNGSTATLAYAFAKSCNTAFAKLSVETIGGDALATEAEKFGLDAPYHGQLTDLCRPPKFRIPLAVCRSSPGSAEDLSEPDRLAQTAIGERDVNVTPLQVAMIAAAVADNGTMMRPYLVSKELSSTLSTISEASPTQLSQVIDPTLDQELVAMMEGVISSPEGTGAPAAITDIPGVIVGGKTGTADHGVANRAGQLPPPHAWFSGFALENGQPKIAVAVIVEDGGVNGNETTGGLAAGPVAKAVMEAYLKSPAGS